MTPRCRSCLCKTKRDFCS